MKNEKTNLKNGVLQLPSLFLEPGIQKTVVGGSGQTTKPAVRSSFFLLHNAYFIVWGQRLESQRWTSAPYVLAVSCACAAHATCQPFHICARSKHVIDLDS